MKKIFIILFLFLLTKASLPPQAEAGQNIYIMTKPGLVPPSVVAQFEEEFNTRIFFEYFNDHEEIIARLNAGTSGDILMVMGYSLENLISKGQIAKLEAEELPNLSNLEERYLNIEFDKGCNFHVPYIVGNIGIVYRQDVLRDFEPTWGYFFDTQKEAAPFTLLDFYRGTIGIALLYLGHSYNTVDIEQLNEAINLLEKTTARPVFMGFSDVVVKHYLEQGFTYVAMSNNGAAARLLENDSRLEFVVPKEGTVRWSITSVINARSAKKELALKWLNFLLRPEIAAQISEYTMSTTPNKSAFYFLSPMIRQNQIIYPPSKVWDEARLPKSVEPITNKYLDYWARLKKL